MNALLSQFSSIYGWTADLWLPGAAAMFPLRSLSASDVP